MSLSDGFGDERGMLERGRQLRGSASLRSRAYQIPSPSTPQQPSSRSQSRTRRPLSWDNHNASRRGSLHSAPETRISDHDPRPETPKSRRNSSFQGGPPSSHVSGHLTVPAFTRPGDASAPSGPIGLRSLSSPSVTTLSTFRPITPSILSADDKHYSYDHLDKGEFRLIMLRTGQKGDLGDIVRCQIFPYKLNEPQPYVALSYAWGDDSDKRNILVGDVPVSVPASLESALRALRDPTKSVWVWADALSINQQDASEKADQVRLMTRIYKKAESVAIWLGPESEDSHLGMQLIEEVAYGAKMPREITARTPAPFSEQNFASVVALFERDYWHRLWVVQEVFNARTINVHCGPAILPWEAFKTASDVFGENRDVLDRSFHTAYDPMYYRPRFGSYTQVLVSQGPASFAGIGTWNKLKDGDNLPDHELFEDLLEVMRTSRKKLSSNPRDKVFGVLGVLCERIRNEIKVDYNISVKDLYIHIFRTIVERTKSLDILRESIHFSDYNNYNRLPSWVPDWSHDPLVSSIAATPSFSASGKAQADVDFKDRNKLRVLAIPLGRIEEIGIPVGTQCTVNDYLTAFVQWRACLLQILDGRSETSLLRFQRDFCLTLSLGQIREGYEAPDAWMELCYYVFASTLRRRLPKLRIDHELEQYMDRDFLMDYKTRRQILQDYFGSNMMGRCFCITDGNLLGLGTGFMTRDDVVVVPLGCSTPVILRPEVGGYRFVGDVYIEGYMDGRAVEECNNKDEDRRIRTYVIQ